MTNKTSRSTRLTLSVVSPLLLAMTGAFTTAAAAEAPTPTALATVTTAISQSDINAIEAMPLSTDAQALVAPVKCSFYDSGNTHCTFYSSGLSGSTTFTDSSMGEFNV